MHIGIDLGGTKTEVIVLTEDSKEIFRHRRDTLKGNYLTTLDELISLVALAESEVSAPCSIGIGIPGTISPDTQRVKNANSTWLIGHPLAKDLAKRLDRPVNIANDADCFTLSEAIDGAGKGRKSVFGVILGTGVGGGIYINQQLHGGPNAIAGEWGHNPLPWPDEHEFKGHRCYCGKHGCIETWLSGPALEREYLMVSGCQKTAKALVATGDKFSQKCLERYCHRLARSLATVINIIDPEIIVLGGGVSNIASIYPEVNRHLAGYVFSDKVNCQVVQNKHGDSSGVRGAAWLGCTP